MYLCTYIYIHIHTQNGILLYCYTHHTSSHNSVMSTAMTIHPILNQLGYDDQNILLAECSVWNLDMFMMFALYQPETFHTSARLQTSHARRH